MMYGGYPYSPYFTPQPGQLIPPGVQPVQMPGMPQNGFQAAQGVPQAVPQGMEVVPVQTIQQVEQVGIQPGQRKMVMVQNDAVVALRVADPVSGLVDTKYFNLVEFDPRAMQPQPTPANYVTPEQLEARLAAFAEAMKQPAPKRGRDAKEESE